MEIATQPICKISKMPIGETNSRRIKEEFRGEDQGRVIAALNNYKHDMEVDRVHRVILDLSKGNVEDVESYVDTANIDPRDVLVADRTPEEKRQAKIIIMAIIIAIVAYVVYGLFQITAT